MREIAQEVGRTVRAAMTSWPETIRLCVLVAVLAAAWTCYHILVHLEADRRRGDRQGGRSRAGNRVCARPRVIRA
jgi:hypothetical protein